MIAWGKRFILGGIASCFVACAGAPPVASEGTTPEPVHDTGPQVMIEGSSLTIIDEAGSSPLVVYFDVDSDVIAPESYGPLEALADFLHNRGDTFPLEVQGHADERGPDAYNRELSVRRAKAVKQYLVERGVDADSLTVAGYGEGRPAATGSGASYDRNRRVEFAIGTQAPHTVAAR